MREKSEHFGMRAGVEMNKKKKRRERRKLKSGKQSKGDEYRKGK